MEEEEEKEKEEKKQKDRKEQEENEEKKRRKKQEDRVRNHVSFCNQRYTQWTNEQGEGKLFYLVKWVRYLKIA